MFKFRNIGYDHGPYGGSIRTSYRMHKKTVEMNSQDTLSRAWFSDAIVTKLANFSFFNLHTVQCPNRANVGPKNKSLVSLELSVLNFPFLWI